MTMSTIAVLVAMIEEAEPLIQAMEMTEVQGAFDHHLPMRAYERNDDDGARARNHPGDRRGTTGPRQPRKAAATMSRARDWRSSCRAAAAPWRTSATFRQPTPTSRSTVARCVGAAASSA